MSPTADLIVKDAIRNNMINVQQQQIVVQVQQDMYGKLNKSANIQILDSSLK